MLGRHLILRSANSGDDHGIDSERAINTGNWVLHNMDDMVEVKCRNCGAGLQQAPDKCSFKCSYCGTEIIADKAITSLSDNKVSDLLEIANASIKGEDFETAISISDKILEIEVKNSEAWIIKGISLIKRTLKIDNYADAKIINIENELKLASSCFEKANRSNSNSTITNEAIDTTRDFAAIFLVKRANMALQDAIIEFPNSNITSLYLLSDAKQCWVAAYSLSKNINIHDTITGIINRLPGYLPSAMPRYFVRGWINDICIEIRKYNSSFKNPEVNGCFIATAAYGDPLATEVLLLKKWRDGYLYHRFIGRIFIKLYYLISPIFARYVAKSERNKLYTRRILSSIIAYLEEAGCIYR